MASSLAAEIYGLNILKANVEDALHNLLVKRNAAYLGPVDAFDDAFDDLRHHQMATLEGIRVAFESMLAEFHPDRLQEQLINWGYAVCDAALRKHVDSTVQAATRFPYHDVGV